MFRIALQRYLFISLVLLPRNAEAQPGPGGKSYMGIGAGLHYGYLRDAGVSPLTYRGPLLHGQANFFFDRTKWDYDLELGFGYGAYEATRSFRVASTVHNVQHNFGALRHVWANPRGSLHLDGALSYRGFTNYRTTTAFRNNANVWESLHSLLAGARFQWDIHLNIAEGKTLFFKKKGVTPAAARCPGSPAPAAQLLATWVCLPGRFHRRRSTARLRQRAELGRFSRLWQGRMLVLSPKRQCLAAQLRPGPATGQARHKPLANRPVLYSNQPFCPAELSVAL